MIYGLYLSAQGARAQATRLDILGNNLANASTDAFKRDLAVFRSHRRYDQQYAAPRTPDTLRDVTGGVTLAEVVTDFSDGPLQKTNAPLDVALRGPGFFRVSDGRQTVLTRDGRFTVDGQRRLVLSSNGYAVLGSEGSPIQIPAGTSEIKISTDGRLLAVSADGTAQQVGQLDVVRPESVRQLEKIGKGLYLPHGRVRSAWEQVQVLQGHIELSGTEPVREMTDLIEASRSFETNVNMIRLQDESLAQLLQSVRPR